MRMDRAIKGGANGAARSVRNSTRETSTMPTSVNDVHRFAIRDTWKNANTLSPQQLMMCQGTD
jgi:hypothetical protein